MNKHYKMSIN